MRYAADEFFSQWKCADWKLFFSRLNWEALCCIFESICKLLSKELCVVTLKPLWYFVWILTVTITFSNSWSWIPKTQSSKQNPEKHFRKSWRLRFVTSTVGHTSHNKSLAQFFILVACSCLKFWACNKFVRFKKYRNMYFGK